MLRDELAHLELLAEVDAMIDRLSRWAAQAPAWQPAEKCRALVRRLADRASSLRVRLEAPLVVATLGGTGTGKSALVNALLGAEVVQAGRARPTTTRPTLVCRPQLTPEMLGIDPGSVELVHRDLPALRDLVLVDCPDPDTTEQDVLIPALSQETRQPELSLAAGAAPLAPSSNLARLRAILPHCDVLLVTTTQQKYRSARVAEELVAAAPGARLVFVQTHADVDDDIRDDWRHVLRDDRRHVLEAERLSKDLPSPFGRGAGGEGGGTSTTVHSQGEREPECRHHPIFFIDSLRALAEAQSGLQPRGEFADLLDLLTRQMSGAARHRIRRANFLDLTADTLDACRVRIDEAMPAVREVQTAIGQERIRLAGQLAGDMQAELLTARRQWESRLLAQTVSRWGLSPFSLVLRVYQGIGGLLSGALLYRARTPAQMALWGALEGMRSWRKHRQTQRAVQGIDRTSVGGFDPAELRQAVIIVDGYVAEAGLDRRAAQWETVAAESETAAAAFVARVSTELESLVARLAQRHAGWFTRCGYEFLLAVMLGLLLYRLGKNFFYDSWLAAHPLPVYGLEFYISAGFWLVLWCLLLLWAFCRRLRRGLRGEIVQLAAAWQDDWAAAGLFSRVEADCGGVQRFSQELTAIRREVDRLRRTVEGREE